MGLIVWILDQMVISNFESITMNNRLERFLGSMFDLQLLSLWMLVFLILNVFWTDWSFYSGKLYFSNILSLQKINLLYLYSLILSKETQNYYCYKLIKILKLNLYFLLASKRLFAICNLIDTIKEHSKTNKKENKISFFKNWTWIFFNNLNRRKLLGDTISFSL